jgi:hypothetical protein
MGVVSRWIDFIIEASGIYERSKGKSGKKFSLEGLTFLSKKETEGKYVEQLCRVLTKMESETDNLPTNSSPDDFPEILVGSYLVNGEMKIHLGNYQRKLCEYIFQVGQCSNEDVIPVVYGDVDSFFNGGTLKSLVAAVNEKAKCI